MNNTVNRIKLSIIIVNWNVQELLKECLNSIFLNFSEENYEVIVIDNASEDDSVERIKEKFPQVKLIVNKENYGFAKACNQGLKIARGEYLFLLNPDARVDPLTLNRIIEFMQENPEVGVGGCYVCNPDGGPQESFYRFPSLLNTFGRMFSLFRILPLNRLTQPFFWNYPLENVPQNIDRVLGGAMVIRREALEQAGYMDESYFLYGEDMDLCYRLKKSGWKISPILGAKVSHYQGQSSKQDLEKVIFFRFQNEFIFIKKFYPISQIALFRLLQIMGASLRLGFWALLFLLNPENPETKQNLKGYLKVLLAPWNYKEVRV
ncbi:MAG: glycosyltransferase family 2 protein [candidate division Zixibacteria bacterium]|nr:glycosyltransferase family 2 protein [candidate division Zixibacteria bacterium]